MWLCSSAVVNGKAFVFGGWSAVSLTAPVYGVVEEFDPGKNSWRMRASMPTARAGLSAIAVNELIYVIGGANQAIGVLGYSNVERYDPSSNKWQTVADIPTGRFGLDTGIVAGKIYAFGGIGSQIYPNVEEYNPATDTWRSRAALAEAQWGMTSSVVDGQVYVIGGSTEQGIGHNSLIANRQFTP